MKLHVRLIYYRENGWKPTLPDICLIFEVHQPLRLNRNFYADLLARGQMSKEDLFNLYFDKTLNQHILNRAAQKCYIPANKIILEEIERFKRSQKQFKLAYSVSGVFIEQCQRWNPSVLESFQQLADTGCVEFLDQTYYHSLSSLFGIDRSEFVEQVKMHRESMKDLFRCEPKVFENSECLYNNLIVKTVEGLGFEAIVTEGVERVLGWRSPNYVYRAKDSGLRVLLRNYRLSDDIGFRFSSTWWNEWPLTANKYAAWLASSQGQAVTLFMDYETFGEHHWPEGGIHGFLRWLPGEVVKWDNLSWRTPSEVVRRHAPVGEIDVHEFGTISWADLERDTSAWIVNPMQAVIYNSVRELEPLVKEIGDEDLIKLWRCLQMSDHLYYMSIKGGGPGDVHSYFNPYDTPIEAFVVCSRILSDFEARILRELERPEFAAKRILRLLPSGRGFTFFYEFARPTKLSVHSLQEFHSKLKAVDLKSIRFHFERGDFERWLRQVVGDNQLADEFVGLSKENLTDDRLRKKMVNAVGSRVKELEVLATRKTGHE